MQEPEEVMIPPEVLEQHERELRKMRDARKLLEPQVKVLEKRVKKEEARQMGANEKIEATGYDGPQVSDEEGRATVARALAAMTDLDEQLNLTTVMNRADEIVAGYNDRVTRQRDVINRLLLRVGTPEEAAAFYTEELDKAHDLVQNRDVRIAYLEKQLKKAKKGR